MPTKRPSPLSSPTSTQSSQTSGDLHSAARRSTLKRARTTAKPNNITATNNLTAVPISSNSAVSLTSLPDDALARIFHILVVNDIVTDTPAVKPQGFVNAFKLATVNRQFYTIFRTVIRDVQLELNRIIANASSPRMLLRRCATCHGAVGNDNGSIFCKYFFAMTNGLMALAQPTLGSASFTRISTCVHIMPHVLSVVAERFRSIHTLSVRDFHKRDPFNNEGINAPAAGVVHHDEVFVLDNDANNPPAMDILENDDVFVAVNNDEGNVVNNVADNVINNVIEGAGAVVVQAQDANPSRSVRDISIATSLFAFPHLRDITILNPTSRTLSCLCSLPLLCAVSLRNVDTLHRPSVSSFVGSLSMNLKRFHVSFVHDDFPGIFVHKLHINVVNQVESLNIASTPAPCDPSILRRQIVNKRIMVRTIQDVLASLSVMEIATDFPSVKFADASVVPHDTDTDAGSSVFCEYCQLVFEHREVCDCNCDHVHSLNRNPLLSFEVRAQGPLQKVVRAIRPTWKPCEGLGVQCVTRHANIVYGDAFDGTEDRVVSLALEEFFSVEDSVLYGGCGDTVWVNADQEDDESRGRDRNDDVGNTGDNCVPFVLSQLNEVRISGLNMLRGMESFSRRDLKHFFGQGVTSRGVVPMETVYKRVADTLSQVKYQSTTLIAACKLLADTVLNEIVGRMVLEVARNTQCHVKVVVVHVDLLMMLDGQDSLMSFMDALKALRVLHLHDVVTTGSRLRRAAIDVVDRRPREGTHALATKWSWDDSRDGERGIAVSGEEFVHVLPTILDHIARSVHAIHVHDDNLTGDGQERRQNVGSCGARFAKGKKMYDGVRLICSYTTGLSRAWRALLKFKQRVQDVEVKSVEAMLDKLQGGLEAHQIAAVGRRDEKGRKEEGTRRGGRSSGVDRGGLKGKGRVWMQADSVTSSPVLDTRTLRNEKFPFVELLEEE